MTYRSAEDALRERTHLLEQEKASLERQRSDGARLDDDKKNLEKNLENAKLLLTRFEQKRALPMLDAVKIASPCAASWNEMQGDDKSRFCGKCAKNVYNLSAMTREEAELLMLEKEGELCVRLYRRRDGTVLTQDCPVGADARVRTKRLRIVGALAIGAGLAATLSGFAAHRALHPSTIGETPPDPTDVHEVMQGAMYVPHEPEPVVPPVPAKVDGVPATMGTVAPPSPQKPSTKGSPSRRTR